LETNANSLCTLHLIAIGAYDSLFCLALLAEDIPVSADEDIVSLVR
jgi:hypothetical protein